MKKGSESGEAATYIKFKAEPEIDELLEKLANKKLLGKDKTAVVRTLVLEGIRAQIRDGIFKKLE